MNRVGLDRGADGELFLLDGGADGQLGRVIHLYGQPIGSRLFPRGAHLPKFPKQACPEGVLAEQRACKGFPTPRASEAEQNVAKT